MNLKILIWKVNVTEIFGYDGQNCEALYLQIKQISSGNY